MDNLSEIVQKLTAGGVPEHPRLINELPLYTPASSDRECWTLSNTDISDVYPSLDMERGACIVIDEDMGAVDLYLAHLKTWLRSREDVDEIGCKAWQSPDGPWLFGIDLDVRLAPDKYTYVSGQGATELEALAYCVLKYLEATE